MIKADRHCTLTACINADKCNWQIFLYTEWVEITPFRGDFYFTQHDSLTDWPRRVFSFKHQTTPPQDEINQDSGN